MRSSTLGSCSVLTRYRGANARAVVFAGAEALQPDGRDPTIPRFVLIRRLADGHRDTSFGVNGEVTTFFEGGARAHGSAIDADGRIVVVGGSGEGTIRSFALARYIV